MRNLLRFLGDWLYAVLITFWPSRKDRDDSQDQSR